MSQEDRQTWLSTAQACQAIHVSRGTLYRWEEKDLIHPVRTDGGQRRYNKAELLSVMGMNNRPVNKITIGYCRVSTSEQKEGLNRQIDVVSQYCVANGYQFKIITDIGSGLNCNKKGLKELIHAICTQNVNRVVINYKDRLLRFGFEIIEQMCKEFDVELEIINQSDTLSYEEELVEDVLSVITVFSSKLYGSRSHKNKTIIKENKKMFKKDDGNSHLS